VIIRPSSAADQVCSIFTLSQSSTILKSSKVKNGELEKSKEQERKKGYPATKKVTL
jgi:hypothetical protein